MSKSEVEVFDVEYYGTKDGPGIRTVLFLKGCSLACEWCHNPESQSFEKQIMYYESTCVGCGRCISICPNHAITCSADMQLMTDPELCTLCGRCVEVCNFNARVVVGEKMSLQKVQSILTKDKDFYVESGGGVTITGGEPLFQHEFLQILLPWLKSQGIHTALETAGAYPENWLISLIEDIDLIFIDFKHLDDQMHKKMTGKSNKQSLYLLELLLQEYSRKTIVRIPVVPGFNHDEASMCSMFEYLVQKRCISEIELLPFHNLGYTKYENLGMKNRYSSVSSLKKEDLICWQQKGSALGLNIRIGAV